MGCCGKPTAIVIKVGDVEAGIMGLNQVLQYVATLGITDEAALKNELVADIRKAGNYVASSRESLYQDALLREYKHFLAANQLKLQETHNGSKDTDTVHG